MKYIFCLIISNYPGPKCNFMRRENQYTDGESRSPNYGHLATSTELRNKGHDQKIYNALILIDNSSNICFPWLSLQIDV